MTHGHDDASVVGLLTQFRVHLHELVLVDVLQHGPARVARVHEVLAQQRLVDGRRLLGLGVGLGCGVLLRVGVRVAVGLDDELREALVLDHIDAILDHADAVEAREDGLGQVDVILEGE